MNTDLKSAIARSISHNEIAYVNVADQTAAYAQINAEMPECDYSTENNGDLDVYGANDNGEEFRLRLVKAAK